MLSSCQCDLCVNLRMNPLVVGPASGHDSGNLRAGPDPPCGARRAPLTGSEIGTGPSRCGDQPAPIGGSGFDPIAGGGLTALRVTDGGKLWFAPSHPCEPPRHGCSPAQSAAVSAIPGAVFSGSLDGHIRAFATKDGSVLWDFDTEKEFSTVNSISAHGGSLDGAGPIVVDGIVYVNSGYPRFGGTIGNVLLAFGPDDAKSR